MVVVLKSTENSDGVSPIPEGQLLTFNMFTLLITRISYSIPT